MILRKSEEYRKKSTSSALGFATVSTAMSLNAKMHHRTICPEQLREWYQSSNENRDYRNKPLMVHRLEECRFTGSAPYEIN